MRRIVVGLAWMVAVAAVIGSPQPVAAHFCAYPVSVDPGQTATVTVGVAAEGAFLVEVAVVVPEGFRLDEAVGAVGWTTARDGATVRFTGGAIAPYTCDYFSLVGVAERAGTFVFPLTVIDDTGTVREYTTQEAGVEYAAQVVYASGTREAERNDGRGLGSVVGLAIVGVAALGAVVIGAGFGLRHVAAQRATPSRR